MRIQDLIKTSAERVEALKKRPGFDRPDEAALRFPEELRGSRMARLKARIDALERRKAQAIASYDRAIAVEKAELATLERQGNSYTTPQPAEPKHPDEGAPKKGSRRPRGSGGH